ncbi:AMP-binding protein [Streptomyces sp. NPDC052101]|uniref:AMP-binding protein n=1 Tax=Streptomyces sp. NPDC052101 TaxID=3155763 RepID=UPI00343A21BD
MLHNPMLGGLLARDPREVMLVDAHSGRRLEVGAFLDEVARCAGALARRGVGRGDRVAITLRATAEFVTVVYACLPLGAVPALFDPAMPPEVAGQGLERLSVALWVTAEGHETGAAAARELFEGPARVAPPVAVGTEHPCLIIHTSGTTGPPKPVVWTCSNVASYLDQQRLLYGDCRLATEFVVLPFLGLMDAALGRTLVLPDLGDAEPGLADIQAAHRQMTALGCDYTFASLAFWRRLASHCRDHRLPLPPVRVATVSGAPASPRVVEDLLRALPQTRIDVHYSSTEAPMPLAVVEARQLAALAESAARRGRGVPVGTAQDTRIAILPLDATDVREFEDSDELPAGGIGEIVVAGPRVSREYARWPQLTARAKLRHRDGSLWHRMGDVGYLDADGMLWFLCRRKHLIHTSHGLVYPDQQEFTYNQRLGLTQCALIAVPDDGLFLVVPADEQRAAPADQVHAIALHLGWSLAHPVAYPGRLPVDHRHSTKIDRPALAAWLTGTTTTVHGRPRT